eukprot:jgi/Chlat1/7928/Chrsp68S07363
MRKKLDTRFPAARIKKIMQQDEDVGKIAMATPVLVSKGLELFLQHLCDKALAVTVARHSRTMSSSHLKACIQAEKQFDFLQPLVEKVPDLGPPTTADARPSRSRRRSVVDPDSDEDPGSPVKRNRKGSARGPRGAKSSAEGAGAGAGAAEGKGKGRPRKDRAGTAGASGAGRGNEPNREDQVSDYEDEKAELNTDDRAGRAHQAEPAPDPAPAAARPAFDLNLPPADDGEPTMLAYPAPAILQPAAHAFHLSRSYSVADELDVDGDDDAEGEGEDAEEERDEQPQAS